MKVCEELASYLKRKGIRSDWTGENVYNKIQHVEQKMKACHDGYVGTKTGAGLKEMDPMGYEDFHSCFRLRRSAPITLIFKKCFVLEQE
jgi:hypothetical protein